MPTWNADQYLKFAEERTRLSHKLALAIGRQVGVTAHTGGDDLLDDILKSIYQFAAGRPIHDDLTPVAADVS
jgi:hypothetical protein